MTDNSNYNLYPEAPTNGPSRVDSSAATGMPDGLLSMRPLVGKGEPTAARNVAVADRMPTRELRSALPKLGSEKAGRVRAVVDRKR